MSSGIECFTGQKEAHSHMHLTAGVTRAHVVVGERTGFIRNSLKQIVDKSTHDQHGFDVDHDVRVVLFHDFVDIIAFLPHPFLRVAIGTAGLGLPTLLSIIINAISE